MLCGRGADARPPAPALLVVPASLLGNWRAEAARFAPSLKLCFLHPAENDRETLAEIASAPAEHLAAADLAITTYTMLCAADLARRAALAAGDPGRGAGDPQSGDAPEPGREKAGGGRPHRPDRHAGGEPAGRPRGRCSTSSIPVLLGSRTVFASFVKKLQARPAQPFAPLRRLVSPYILRRLKTDPQHHRLISPRRPRPTATASSPERRSGSTSTWWERCSAPWRPPRASSGADWCSARCCGSSRCATIPASSPAMPSTPPGASGKFLRLAELCEELAARQERVLIFTQYREIIDPLAEYAANPVRPRRAGAARRHGGGRAARRGRPLPGGTTDRRS